MKMGPVTAVTGPDKHPVHLLLGEGTVRLDVYTDLSLELERDTCRDRCRVDVFARVIIIVKLVLQHFTADANGRAYPIFKAKTGKPTCVVAVKCIIVR